MNRLPSRFHIWPPKPYQPGHRNHLPEGYDIASGKSAYRPNRIPLWERIRNLALSIALIAYGYVGILVDDLVVFGRRTALHLHGAAAWLMYGALLAGSLLMLSVVVDHFDRRDNERSYKRFSRVMFAICCALFVLSVGTYVWNAFMGIG